MTKPALVSTHAMAKVLRITEQHVFPASELNGLFTLTAFTATISYPLDFLNSQHSTTVRRKIRDYVQVVYGRRL